MELLLSWWPNIETFLKVAPGIILFPLSAYLALQKYGQKITLSYSGYANTYSASRFTNGTITNKKDKSISVHSIFIKINKEMCMEIKEFCPPIAIKSYESLNFEFDDVSHYSCGEDILHYGEILFSGPIEFFACTPQGIIKCALVFVPDARDFASREELRLITPVRHVFHGITFDERVCSAIKFTNKGSEHTSLITNDGFITHDWPFSPNVLSPETLTSSYSVSEFIKGRESLSSIQALSVHDLRRGPFGANENVVRWERSASN